MKKAFYTNIGLLILINLLVKPLYLFGIDAQVQNQVGNSDYGTYFALFNFLFIFQWILDPGIQNYNSQALSNDRSTFEARLGYTLASKCLTAIGFVLIAGLLSYLFFGHDSLIELSLLCTNMVILSFVVYLRTQFSAMGYYVTDSLLSALDKLLLILGLGYFLYFSETQMTIPLFLLVQSITLIITLSVVVFFFVRRLGRLRLAFDYSQIKVLMREAFPYAIVFILMSLYSRMDGVMLKSIIDDEAVSAGIYAAGFRVYDAMNMIGFLFGSLLLPMFANILSDRSRLSELYDSALRLILVIAATVSIVAYLYSADIMSQLYTGASSIHTDVFQWLAISYYLVATTYVFGALITASGRLKRLNWLFLIGVPINFVLNWLLIPDLHAEGAAIATCLTQGVILIGQIILVHSQFAFKVNLSLIIHYTLLFGLIFATSVIVDYSLDWHWILEIGIIGIIALGYILGSRFLRLDSILDARKTAA